MKIITSKKSYEVEYRIINSGSKFAFGFGLKWDLSDSYEKEFEIALLVLKKQINICFTKTSKKA